MPGARETSAPSPFRPYRHDHAACVGDAVDAAERVCAERGVRFTALRRRVFELIWRQHRPVRAYDLLDALRQERSGVAPPTIYRALEFLLENGLIHRIEHLHAFVGCGEPGAAHMGQFLTCLQCNAVGELCDPDISSLVERKAGRAGFRVSRQTIEVAGLCPACIEEGHGGLAGD